MATYSFETINSAQAAAFTSDDLLAFNSGPASHVTVAYDAGSVTLTLADRIVTFSSQLAQATQLGRATFADGSILFVGGDGGDVYDHGPFDGTVLGLYGGSGDDTLNSGNGDSHIQGNAGADHILIGSQASSTVYGGADDDVIGAWLGPMGTTPGRNFIQGNKGDDEIHGGWGADTLVGGQGADTISCSGPAADLVSGDLGNDIIYADGAGDQAFGGDGDDTLYGEPIITVAVHILHGGAGNDTLNGFNAPVGLAPATNIMWGDDGNDSLTSSSQAHDDLHGGAGDDTVTSSNGGADLLDGGDGNDRITAGASQQNLQGGAGDDFLGDSFGYGSMDGGAGNDLLSYSGAGPETISGGAGSDTFEIGGVINQNSNIASTPHIVDWSAEDKLDFFVGHVESLFPYSEQTASSFLDAKNKVVASGIAVGAWAFQIGSDILVFATADGAAGMHAVTLVGRTLADIDAGNFV